MPFKRVPGLRSVYVAARLAKTIAAVKVSRVVLVDGSHRGAILKPRTVQ